ncbi:hypothetical protein GCM10027290_18200 [Micromonospora sonneratiae]|uniref:Uncharacterized protein n=1 Tax=Micromonospora sonneratiae TaxID=1184706 RepID=A0ABW3YBG1_9ACTN
MPIKTYTGTASFPVDTADDVTALVELLSRAAVDDKLRNDLGDHFAYVAGVCPEWFRPHQETVITQFLDVFDVTFDNLCVLLNGAPATCVERLERRLRNRWSFREAWALAAIGTEPALTAIADLVREGTDPKEFEDSGIWTPSTGPAQYRFSPHRRVVELRSASGPAELVDADHPVGIRLGQIVRHPDSTAIAWHYLSLRLSEVPGMPDWPTDRVHLVSPQGSVGWTLTAALDRDGFWHSEIVTFDEPPENDVEDSVDNDDQGSMGVVVLRPYDDSLTYSNGHVLSTPGIFGTAGGPAIGLYPNPHCRSCDRLMFHVVTVQSQIREYGHGWRSLYLCEECQFTTCTATNWN